MGRHQEDSTGINKFKDEEKKQEEIKIREENDESKRLDNSEVDKEMLIENN